MFLARARGLDFLAQISYNKRDISKNRASRGEEAL